MLSLGCADMPRQDRFLVTPFLQYSDSKYRHTLLYGKSPEVPWQGLPLIRELSEGLYVEVCTLLRGPQG